MKHRILGRILACTLLAYFLAGFFTLFLAGCAVSTQPSAQIVVTQFAAYDWLRQLLAGQPEITVNWLMDNGVDPHSYQPTADDLVALADCRLFVLVGGESDSWAQDVLAATANPNRQVVRLVDLLADPDCTQPQPDPADPALADHAGHDHAAIDEHVWLSLVHAQTLCTQLAEVLGRLWPQQADVFAQNAAAYNAQLAQLHAQYTARLAQCPLRTLVVADRFPFRHLLADYDLQYFAAFDGCSAESEASFSTVMALADQVDALALDYLVVTETADPALAKTVIATTATGSQQVLVVDSMQAKTAAQVADGATYLGCMQQNLNTLCQALGGQEGN